MDTIHTEEIRKRREERAERAERRHQPTPDAEEPVAEEAADEAPTDEEVSVVKPEVDKDFDIPSFLRKKRN